MRKRKKLAARIWITALSAAFVPSAGAVPLTFQFAGVIDLVEESLPFSDQVAVGMPYTGIYQFDPEGVENSSGLPTRGLYQFGNAGLISVNIGSANFMATDLSISVLNSTLFDLYQVGSATSFLAESVLWQGMGLDLQDLTHMAFDSVDLPLSAPDLDDFQLSRQFYLRQPSHRFPSITGTVDTLTMIPEPSSLATLFAAAMLASLRRRHANRPREKRWSGLLLELLVARRDAPGREVK